MTDLPVPPTTGSLGDSASAPLREVDVAAAYARAFELTKKFFFPVLGMTVMVWLAQGVFVGIQNVCARFGGQGLGFVAGIVHLCAAFVLGTNATRFYLKIHDEGQVDYSELLRTDQASQVIVMGLISGVIVCFLGVLGMIFLIIPGIYIFLRFFPLQTRLAENARTDFRTFLSEIWESTRGQTLKFVLVFFYAFLTLVAGLVCLVIGVIPAMILVMFVNVCIYRQLFPAANAGKAQGGVSGVDAPFMIT